MEQNLTKNDVFRHRKGFYARTYGFALLCGLFVILMRSGLLQSMVITEPSGIVFSLSDFFVILAGGICGYRYGMVAFGMIFFWELYFISQTTQDYNGMFSLSLYLFILLLSGYFASRRWFESIFRTFLAGIALVLMLGGGWYALRTFLFQQGFGVYEDIPVMQLYFSAMPEVSLALIAIYLLYRFLPDKHKLKLGEGYLYTENFRRLMEKSPTNGRSVLGTVLTLIGIAEAVILSFFAVLLADGHMQALNILGTKTELQRTVIDIRYFCLMLCLSMPVAIILNEIMLRMIVWPINRMAAVMDNYFAEDTEGRKKSVQQLEHWGFSAKNELGRLYRALCHMMAAMSDYIENIKREQELQKELRIAEESGKAKTAFFSSVSHELRTPINAVLGMDEMILRESREDQVLEYAKNIQSAGNSLLNLINDILDFSKIEAGKMDLVPANYEFVSMLNDLSILIKNRAEQKGLAFHIEADSNIPGILFGDDVRIKQVITNILTNAVKYTENGSVTLAAAFQKLDEETILLEISVADTGIGIKEEDQKKLFSAFERIEENRNRNIEGTGLGMNITQNLLKMMDSKLNVHSIYGKGSTFSFQLEQKVIDWTPIGDFQTASKQASQKQKGYHPAFYAPDAALLAVDDTQLNLDVFCGLLKHTKIHIDTALSGKECLEKLTQKQYDLIFLDHQMPEMDGIETMQRIRSLDGNRNPGVPVIALTANISQEAKEEYLSKGFTGYLSKPIDSKKLEDLLHSLLPKDKVVLKMDEKEETEPLADAEEINDLPVVDGLDWNLAKLHLPDMELLKTTMRDFYHAIPSRAEKLDDAFHRLPAEEAWETYRITVHSMKSLSATVGFSSSSGLAKILENAASQKDLELIQKLHAVFQKEWLDNQNRLNGVFGLGEEQPGPSLEYDPQMVRSLLETVKSSMQELDIDKADPAMQLLIQYEFPDSIRHGIQELADAVTELDDDAAVQISDGLLKQI